MTLLYFEGKKPFYQNVFFNLNIVCKNIVCDVGLKEKKKLMNLTSNERLEEVFFFANGFFVFNY